MAGIQYEIKENLGVISTSKSGWTKELKIISWDGREAKYDIREWSPDHQKMSKGLTFSNEEVKTLLQLLQASVKEV